MNGKVAYSQKGNEPVDADEREAKIIKAVDEALVASP